MRYHYPMLTEIETSRQFIIDAMPYLHGAEYLLREYGFNITGNVRDYLYNMTADINDLEELDELVLDIADILTDLGQPIKFIPKGYIIGNGPDD